jgi:hypothetical protein
MEAITKTNGTALSAEVVSSLVLNGDVSKMTPEQKVQYYTSLCDRIGLDPATQPFKLLRLNGKEILYADKGATQQLSKNHNISHEVTRKESVGDVYVVTVRAKMGDRFTDEDGAVTIGGLKGDALANALMKAVTKAKRRAVLALMGLGMLDESEVETIPGAQSMPSPLAPSTADAMPEREVEVEPERPDYNAMPEQTPVLFGARSIAFAKKGKQLRVEDLTTDELQKAIQWAAEKPQFAEWSMYATKAFEIRKAQPADFKFPDKPIKEAK